MTAKEIGYKQAKKLKSQEYNDLQKDNKPDQVRRAFEHKPYTVDDYLKKVGVAIDGTGQTE